MATDKSKRIPGQASYASNFEVKKQALLDAREVILTTASDLVNPKTWEDEEGKVWLAKGLKVSVMNNGGKPELYILKDPDKYTDPGSWEKIGESEETDKRVAELAAAQLERLTVRFDGTVADATILQNSALEPKRVLWVESKKRFAASAESMPSATPELYDNWLGLAGSAVPYGRDEYMDGGSVRADKAYLCGGDVYVCDPSTQSLVKVGGSGGGDTSALETRVAALETADRERLPVPFHGTVATATVLLQSTQTPMRIYWVESERRFAADASALETNPPGQLYSNWLATGGLPGADEFMSSLGIEPVVREDKIFVSGAKCYLWDSESQTLVTPQGGGADKVVVIDISTLNVPNENKTNSFQDVDLGAGFDEIMNAVETGGPVMFKLNGGSVTPLTSFKASDEMVTFVCLIALGAKTWAVTITSQEEGVSNVTINVSDAKDLVGLNGGANVEIVSELPGSPDEGTVYIIRGS